MGFFTGLRPHMDSTFYWMIFVVFSVIFFVAFLGSRLDYWKIQPNEIINRTGIFRRMCRFSTESVRWDKIIPT